ncbi:MAG: response regulator [Proteobacteria bacterium]|nr:response regulator [Pseudomonadota bacterium]
MEPHSESPAILIVDDDTAILDAYRRILSPSQAYRVDLSLSDAARDLFSMESAGASPQRTDPAFQVTTKLQGEEGVKAVAESVKTGRPYSVAFIDMRMPPGIDGLETAQRILAVDPNIEIVFVTAYSDRTRQEIGKKLENRRFFYLKKPFDFDEVLQMAESLTLRWETARERERVERMMSEFVTTTSHELRTPLSAITGFVGLFLDGDAGAISEEQKGFLEVVQRNAIRMDSLLGDLLDVQKIGLRKLALAVEAVDLSRTLEEVCRTYHGAARQKKLDLIVDIERDIVIKGDKQRLIQAFGNLVSNAIKYTDSGWVRVDLNREGTSVIGKVGDSGVGLSPKDISGLFTRFFRVDNASTRETSGTGLGLAIAKSLVELHKGHVEVASEPNGGTEFRIVLPVNG